MISKLFVAATLAAASLAAYAGEDSTHRPDAGGTGATFWETPGGPRALARAQSDEPRGQAVGEDMSAQDMRAMMEDAQHRCMTGGAGATSEPRHGAHEHPAK